MKNKMEILILMLGALVLFPCHGFGQSGDPKPPPCCKQDPPPPESGGMVSSSTSVSEAMPLISISDADLRTMGFTRSQFLDRLAATLFPGGAGTVDLIIPVFYTTALTSMDGALSAGADAVQVIYYRIEMSLAAPEVVDALNLLLLTDGRISLQVVFISGPGDANG